MVGTQDIVLVIEVLLLITMVLSSYYGRKLDMRRHHYLIYGTIAVQILIVSYWMIPSVFYWSGEDQLNALLIFHIIIGSITLIASIILAIVFLKQRNDFDLPTLRWTKPLMIFTFFSWILAFILGTLVYIDKHILG